MILPILIIVGAIRLARPHSPWARWRYVRRHAARAEEDGPGGPARAAGCARPLIAAKIWFQDMIAGRPDRPDITAGH